MKNQKEISIFKKYLQVAEPYVGGKTMDEIKSKKDKIYKLSSNENPLGVSPKALKAVQKHSHDFHIYPDRTDKRLREALADFYKDELTENQFIGTPSGSEIIDLIIRAFVKEGTEVIVSNPCFKPYTMFATWIGGKIVDVPLLEPDFSLDIKGILKAINANTRLLFLTSPNNPTGTYIPKKDLDKLLKKLPKHVVVVMDEVYYHFADAEDYTTALPYVKKGHQIIGVNSFSKTYGLASLRIGYCYTTPELAGYIRQLCKPFLINKLSLEAGIAALKDKKFVQKTVDLVQKERQYLYKKLDKIGIPYWKAQGNFILLQPSIPTTDFEDFMLQEGGVMVRPVGNFGAPGCVRVTIGTRQANKAFVKALQKLTKSIKK